MHALPFIVLLFTTALFAAQPIHSSLSLYTEDMSFTNSKQKTDGRVYGLGADLHHDAHEFRFATEYAKTNTIRPQLKEDLQTHKLFASYGYALTPALTLKAHALHVPKDNIAPTAYGTSYGAGIDYKFTKKADISLKQFFSEYRDFDVAQSDITLNKKFALGAFRFKLSLLSHYITMHSYKDNAFSKNAQNTYLSGALKLHAHYDKYHFGAAAYTGERLFAVMADGFKIQHHAMEFDRTYALGTGINIDNYVLRLQYIYQRAEEIPMKNENVKVQNIRVVFNYKL
ncbi:MAG: hypothetical protein RBR54_05345 [Sulfurimonas sp.]|jgi:hypothetical protein|nr:hypothetical protein [Sulfurimonas sp.]